MRKEVGLPIILALFLGACGSFEQNVVRAGDTGSNGVDPISGETGGVEGILATVTPLLPIPKLETDFPTSEPSTPFKTPTFIIPTLLPTETSTPEYVIPFCTDILNDNGFVNRVQEFYINPNIYDDIDDVPHFSLQGSPVGIDYNQTATIYESGGVIYGGYRFAPILFASCRNETELFIIAASKDVFGKPLFYLTTLGPFDDEQKYVWTVSTAALTTVPDSPNSLNFGNASPLYSMYEAHPWLENSYGRQVVFTVASQTIADGNQSGKVNINFDDETNKFILEHSNPQLGVEIYNAHQGKADDSSFIAQSPEELFTLLQNLEPGIIVPNIDQIYRLSSN